MKTSQFTTRRLLNHTRDLALCILAVCLATACHRHADSPRIDVSIKDWNYGTITGLKEARIDVPIRNTGKSPLNIFKVSSSCECVVADLSTDKIAPSEAGTLTLRVPARYSDGPSRQTVSITSNDPRSPVLFINITGNHKQPVSVTCRELLFDAMVRGAEKTLSFRVTRHDGVCPDASNIRTQSPLRLAFRPRSDKPDSCDVDVTFDTKSLPLGDWCGSIIVAQEYGLTTAARATVLGDVAYEPQTPRLRRSRDEGALEAKFTVRSRTQRPFAITSIDGGNLALATRLTPCSERGDAYTVTLSLSEADARAEEPRLLSSTVALFTDSPDQPRIDVPVMAVVGERMPNAGAPDQR